MKVPKDYNPHEVEAKWQKKWEELGIHRFNREDLETPTYVIDTPPPYASQEGGTEWGISHRHGVKLDLLRYCRTL